MTRLALIALIGLACLAGCGDSEPETPVQGLEAIIELYEARDYATLVHTRYAEIDKAETEAQVNEIIRRFEERFASEQVLAKALESLRAAAEVEPTISEDGVTAVFNMESGHFRLSRMADGRWGFRL